ncbi:proteinral transcription repressor [Mortierella sp. AD031]|nr:proteinral transcription repressor [Mortierella sp. AD031]KAG0198942.1 general transcription repressor [Mortierella sp. NVP41]
MSGIYNHRPMVPGRSSGLPEWLDLIKQEFESLSHEAMVAKAQRDECEHKINSQIQEMDAFKRTLYDLERKHESMKNQCHVWEEEVARLRQEVEQRGGAAQPPHPHQHSQPPPPNIGQGHSNLFGGIISGGPGGPGLIAPPQMVDPSQQPPHGQQHPPQQPPQQQQAQQQPPQHHMQAQQQQQHHQQQHMQQQHPYGGPGGPNMPQGGPAPHSPYMNGSSGLPPQQGQPQPKRFKTENEGPRFKTEGDIPPPGYNNMSPTPHSNGQGPPGMGPSYNAPPPPSSKPSAKPGKAGPYIQAKEESVSSPVSNKRKPAPGPSTPTAVARTNRTGNNTSSNWSDDPDNVPPQLKREGADWFAISNPKVPQLLKVDLVHTMEHSSVVCCVRFDADGKYLATGCNRSAQIYDIHTGQTVCVLADDAAGKDDLYIRSVCFSPDGKYLATGAEDKQIRIWEIGRKKIRMVLKGHEQDIYSLDFSRDGRIIVSGSGDQTARVWDTATGKCLFVLTVGDVDMKDAGVTSVAISPDGRLVAAGSLDRMVRVWDTQTGQLLEKLEGHKDSVYSVAFAPDGKTLVSGSLDRTLKSWDLDLSGRHGSRGTTCKATFNGHKDFVLSVAVSPDGKWVVSGSKDRGVQFWDPNTTAVQFMLQGHKNSVISVAMSPAGSYFATGSGDTRARVWSYESTHQE